jgi:hypothetical protein
MCRATVGVGKAVRDDSAVISKHHGVQERAGLVQRERGQQQLCRVHSERLGAAANWIVRHRALLERPPELHGGLPRTEHESKEDR